MASERPALPVWPDEEARACAAAFVRESVTVSPRDGAEKARALAAFVSPELAESIAPELDERGGREIVEAVAFAREAEVDGHHALLTFAVTRGSGSRYLTVPTARDDRGGLVVDELPSFAAPPRVASVAAGAPARWLGQSEMRCTRSSSGSCMRTWPRT